MKILSMTHDTAFHFFMFSYQNWYHCLHRYCTRVIWGLNRTDFELAGGRLYLQGSCFSYILRHLFEQMYNVVKNPGDPGVYDFAFYSLSCLGKQQLQPCCSSFLPFLITQTIEIIDTANLWIKKKWSLRDPRRTKPIFIFFIPRKNLARGPSFHIQPLSYSWAVALRCYVGCLERAQCFHCLHHHQPYNVPILICLLPVVSSLPLTSAESWQWALKDILIIL